MFKCIIYGFGAYLDLKEKGKITRSFYWGGVGGGGKMGGWVVFVKPVLSN